jgi:hypothetical protein
MSDEDRDGDRVLRADQVRHEPEVAVRRDERQDPLGLEQGENDGDLSYTT